MCPGFVISPKKVGVFFHNCLSIDIQAIILIPLCACNRCILSCSGLEKLDLHIGQEKPSESISKEQAIANLIVFPNRESVSVTGDQVEVFFLQISLMHSQQFSKRD